MEKLLQRLKINPTLHESSLCASVGLKSWLGEGCGSAADTTRHNFIHD